MEFLVSVLYGVLEGITEWLPVSSTGHLILLEELLQLSPDGASKALSEAFTELFQVVIQLGAIGAVAVKFFDRLFPVAHFGERVMMKETARLYGRLILSGIPAAVIGLVGDRVIEALTGKDIDAWCYRASVVAGALILYGVLFLIPERCFPKRKSTVCGVYDIGIGTAIGIGCFQALSVIPGTSRSGSTILGGMLLGLPRETAAEYSFLLAVPTMAGASLLKTADFVSFVVREGITVPTSAYLMLALGTLTAFLVSLAAIGFLMDFVKKHSFFPFGIYRILLGVAVLLFR